jgi:hypothetical protein
MEARFLRAALLAAAFLSLGAGRPYYSARSQHFIVSAPTPELAQEISNAAEKFRHDLAIEWLGRPLPEWQGVCPIKADVSPGLGAGGATSFVFRGGTPTEWTMNIQGSRERVLDSVLPHEITHTIFATHFGRPLPRWADEGGSTTVEHNSEKAKQDKFLVEFLTTNRGIAFNDMFRMKDYPKDILPLYSQGYSLARFFIQQGGKPKFVQYVGEGMRTSNWTATTKKFYGYSSLSELQLTWVDWVRQGTPLMPDGSVPPALLASNRTSDAVASTAGQASSATPVRNAVATAPAPDPRNMTGTQMASLMQQPRSRIPEGALASWQTAQSQNARVFAQGDDSEMPPLPPNYVAPTPKPNALPDAGEISRVSRPVSEGWYARRRDQAQAAQAAQAAPASAASDSPPKADTSAGTTNSAAQTSPAPKNPQARSSPRVIEAQPLNPTMSQTGQSASPKSNVVLEWTRPADQPFVPRSELTGIAVNDSATLMR